MTDKHERTSILMCLLEAGIKKHPNFKYSEFTEKLKLYTGKDDLSEIGDEELFQYTIDYFGLNINDLK